MARDKIDISNEMDEIESKIQDTMVGLPRGYVADAVKILGPAMLDQLRVMREILDRTGE